VLLGANELERVILRTTSLDALVAERVRALISAAPLRDGGVDVAHEIGFPLPAHEINFDESAVFVAHPFTEPFAPADLRRALDKALGDQGLKPDYADETLSSGHILRKVCRQIQESLFGIYDVSLWKPNVTLELGLAYGMERPTLLLLNVNHSKGVPSDIQGFDRIEYGSYTELEAELASKLGDFIRRVRGTE